MRFNLTAKKLAIIILAIVIVLLGGAFALAKTGHFEPLAKLLNIKADTTVQSMPSSYTFCVEGGGNSPYAGVYNQVTRPNGGIPYYQKGNYFLYANYDTTYSNGARWVLNTTLDQPYYSSSPYTQHCSNNTLQACAPGPADGTWSWGNDNTKLIGRTGNVDPNTCLPSEAGVHGKVKDSAGAIISGATVRIISTNQQTITSDDPAYNYGFKPLQPSTYQLEASKEGYGSDTKDVTISSGQMAELDFILTSSQDGKSIGIAGSIVDQNDNPIKAVKVKISCAGYPCLAEPKGPWALETTESMRLSDDGSNKKYNYAALGLSPITGSQYFLLEYTIPEGWYFDINENGIDDDNWNGQLRVAASEFSNTPYTLESGKYKVVYKDLVLTPTSDRLNVMGFVRDEGNEVLSGVTIKLYDSRGTLIKSASSLSSSTQNEQGWKYEYIIENLPQEIITDNKESTSYLTFEKNGYVLAAILDESSNYIGREITDKVYLYNSDIVKLEGLNAIFRSVKMVREATTIINGRVRKDEPIPTDIDLRVGLKIGGYSRNGDFEQDFANSDATTGVDEDGRYQLKISSSKFPYLGLGNTMDVEVCAVAAKKNGDKNYGCHAVTTDIVIGGFGIPFPPQLFTIEKGQVYNDKDIVIDLSESLFRVQYLSAVDGNPINLIDEKIESEYFTCIDNHNEYRDECLMGQYYDINDPTFSTRIYRLSNTFLATTDVTNFVIHSFETTNYELVPPSHDLHGGDTDIVYLIPKSNKENAFYCEQHGGMWFATFRATKDELFSSTRKSILDEMGKLYVQISYSAGMQVPSFFIDNSSRGGAYEVNPFEVSCLNTKYAFSLSTRSIDDHNVHNWVHEIGHVIDFAKKLTDNPNNGFINNFNAGNSAKCNGLYASKYPCFSDYAFHTNPWEMWAEFFATWVTQMDKINAALADPNVSKDCKNVLKHLLAIMDSKFPNMSHYGLGSSTSSTDRSTSSVDVARVLAATTSSPELTAIMKEFGYQEVQAPTVNVAISDSALFSLTPTQILAGKWLKENYDKLGPIQKANFNLGVISSQVNMWVTNNRAITYIRTQIANMSAQIENWLGALGFNFTSSKLSGTLLDQDGKPVSGFKITVGETPEKGKFDITDANGQFSISRLPTGSQRLMINDPKNNNASYAVYEYFSKNIEATITVAPKTNYTKYLMIKR